MPELPEVEHLRRTLEPHLIGWRIERAVLLRDDVLTTSDGLLLSSLEGCSIGAVLRHGKQLLLATDGPALGVHLGMSGMLLVAREPAPKRPHLHACLRLRRRRGVHELRFHDPRRFGWLALHRSMEEARRSAWNRLGPDALQIDAGLLANLLGPRRGAIKGLLLDQTIVAGLGNIYADEALFRAGIHPRQSAAALRQAALARLAESCRTILVEAISAGGSSIRDYVDACGFTGEFVAQHAVYGRAEQPCRRCSTLLRRCVVAGRTTVFCPRCQVLKRTSRRQVVHK